MALHNTVVGNLLIYLREGLYGNIVEVHGLQSRNLQLVLIKQGQVLKVQMNVVEARYL